MRTCTYDASYTTWPYTTKYQKPVGESQHKIDADFIVQKTDVDIPSSFIEANLSVHMDSIFLIAFSIAGTLFLKDAHCSGVKLIPASPHIQSFTLFEELTAHHKKFHAAKRCHMFISRFIIIKCWWSAIARVGRSNKTWC